jgi:polysaccharide export outer membrane protein
MLLVPPERVRVRRYHCCSLETSLALPGLFELMVVAATLLAPQSAAPLPAEKPEAAAGAEEVEYTIGPSDVLQVIVWKEPELSRELTVRFDGMVTMPLVGDLRASGRTPAQLAQTLADGLRRFVEVPRVTVSVSQAKSAHFYVVGQVQKSGEFPLAGPTTVLQALALAGGFKDFAKTESIVIIRRNQAVVPVNYKRIADGRDVSQNVVLGPGDTILVP